MDRCFYGSHFGAHFGRYWNLGTKERTQLVKQSCRTDSAPGTLQGPNLETIKEIKIALPVQRTQSLNSLTLACPMEQQIAESVF